MATEPSRMAKKSHKASQWFWAAGIALAVGLILVFVTMGAGVAKAFMQSTLFFLAAAFCLWQGMRRSRRERTLPARGAPP